VVNGKGWVKEKEKKSLQGSRCGDGYRGSDTLDNVGFLPASHKTSPFGPLRTTSTRLGASNSGQGRTGVPHFHQFNLTLLPRPVEYARYQSRAYHHMSCHVTHFINYCKLNLVLVVRVFSSQYSLHTDATLLAIS
jgi:hypothetical protein